jgi:hypothetical protein
MKIFTIFFIVLLAFLHPTLSNAKDVNITTFSCPNQELAISNYSQAESKINFIETDLIELTEDDISHFERKFVATLRTGLNRDDYFFDLSEAILISRMKLRDIFVNPYSSIQSFIGVYRI